MVTYLITGSAGFIGSHLCEYFLKNKINVVGVDNFNHFYDPSLKRNNVAQIAQTAQAHGTTFIQVEGDIRDEGSLKKAFDHAPIDCVIHLAAMAGVRPSLKDPLLYSDVNVRGTLMLLEVMRLKKIKNLVFGSSSSVYGLNDKVPFCEDDPVRLPFSPYASTKMASELDCHVYHKVYGMNVAALRFFTVYGPRQRPDLAIRKFAELILKDQPIPILGDGSFKRDFTYIDDIIDGIAKAVNFVEQKGGFDVFNLGESETTDVLTLVTLLEKALGKKAIKQFLAEMPGDVPITYADISKSKKILDYNPKTKIADGIPKFVEWLKQQ